MVDVSLYRDHEYGALALLPTPRRGLEVLDHGFHAAHFESVLTVLERHGRAVQANEWRLESHGAVVLSSVEAALLSHGYAFDRLGARAVLSVDEATARSPDLPIERRASISESVGRWVDEHLRVVEGALGCSFGVSTFQRARRDDLRRPLPFLRARALSADVRAERCAREKLAPLGAALVRVSRDGGVLEIAIAPTRAHVAECELRAAPTFSANVVGTRATTFAFASPMHEAVMRDFAARAKACSAAVRFERCDEGAVAHVPVSFLDGEPSVDPAFRERTAWLALQLGQWEPALVDVGDVVRPD